MIRAEWRPRVWRAAAFGSAFLMSSGLLACSRPKTGAGHALAGVSEEVSAEAVAEAERRMEAAPHDLDARVQLARLLRVENAARAAKLLRETLRESPSYEPAYGELASLFAERGYLDRLLELTEQRLSVAPNDVDALLRSARIYRQIYQVKTAQARVGAALRIAPNDPRVVGEQFDTFYRQGEYEKALEVAEAAARRDPADHVARYRASEPLRILKRFDAAEASIREAIRLKPDHGLYWRQLAHVLAIGKSPGRQAEAERAARTAIEKGDDNIDTRYWLALSIDQQGRTADAIAAYEHVAKLDISYERTAYRLGLLYRQVGRVDESRKMLALFDRMDRNLQVVADVVKRYRENPSSAANALRFAAVLRSRGEDPYAVVVLRRALPVAKDGQVRRMLAAALDDLGRRTEASEVRKGVE